MCVGVGVVVKAHGMRGEVGWLVDLVGRLKYKKHTHSLSHTHIFEAQGKTKAKNIHTY
jgi:hypothetical protein